MFLGLRRIKDIDLAKEDERPRSKGAEIPGYKAVVYRSDKSARVGGLSFAIDGGRNVMDLEKVMKKVYHDPIDPKQREKMPADNPRAAAAAVDRVVAAAAAASKAVVVLETGEGADGRVPPRGHDEARLSAASAEEKAGTAAPLGLVLRRRRFPEEGPPLGHLRRRRERVGRGALGVFEMHLPARNGGRVGVLSLQGV